MKKLLPIILALIGIGAGVGAGIMLKPEHSEMVDGDPCGNMVPAEEHHASSEAEEDVTEKEYVKLNNQFVVPIVANDRVASMVVLTLSLEVSTGDTTLIYAKEPKLRDAFLQVLFDHANMGGFKGSFTNSNNMDILRGSLMDIATKVMGDLVTDVLIVDIARQDV
ncbi:MAG: flagellar basal body-associated FliL family protein [Paracoccaceae bacterium]